MLGIVWIKTTVLGYIIISQLSFEVTPASPAHIHKHHLNKEREEDGSFVPRDHNHITDGEHRTEFDHEAILGQNETFAQNLHTQIHLHNEKYIYSE